ncbi:helicase-related protein [Flavobacterium sp. N1719]|uniref:helicase-related protein n=1 Tax=Flavobacterium sp. N1719 TaxID=2885633 RepID=UPI002222DD71|nr:helicase-related protein [Flavobacterium sp. N1719]
MREDILNFIKRELIGPDPIKPHLQENGEEILFNEPPRLRYGAGILFPKAAFFDLADSTSTEEKAVLDKDEDDKKNNEDPIKTGDSMSPVDMSEDFEEEIGLANSFLPSAMGFSCFTQIPQEGFNIKVNVATYHIKDYTYSREDRTMVTRKAYYRVPLDQEFIVNNNEIPSESGKSVDRILLDKDGKEINLKLNIRNRTHEEGLGDKVHLLTFTLINFNTGGAENIKNEDCFFQVSFSVSATKKCFHPYKIASASSDKEDEKSNLLLFRNKKTFAVGHGCSPSWNDNDIDLTNVITTNAIPSYEIKPIVPNELKSVELKMFDLSNLSSNDVTVNLIKLNSEYEKWIDEQEAIANKEFQGMPEFLSTANRHIESCRLCLSRMEDGVQLLKSNKKVNRAFRLMNHAMLLQQLNYSIETRNWIIEKGNITGLKDAIIPNILDSSTWSQGLGAWRPFQLAFILMNLNSMFDVNHQDREMVDLIWFPTGGGKTEAYLGLSAFTIFLKRLKNKGDSGTTVLMRYTLRLLTAQQFQRAASLICACDKIRKENEEELGTERITIGLWVGELTPNKRDDAKKAFLKMEQGREEDNPFIVLKCPCCGTQMGYLKDAKMNKVKGYKRRKVGTKESIVYQCDNVKCDFSKADFNLPLLVIDEDIYDYPPTLLIGTVDKFAMLTWKPEAKTLFGFRGNDRPFSPPELIIQDELHLISGPLGSMVGLYETMIEELCTENNIKPKIIASSATISRAKEQINSLYGRGTNNVNIFPAQCLNAGDSFFAKEDSSSTGRIYAGIFASALPSHATAQVRVISALLQSVKSIPVPDEKLRDPYWTSLIYFNSIRELGHAATLIRADIREYMNSIWIRKGIKGDERRFINRDIELTSRINSNDIPEYLEQLLKSWTGDKSEFPVDVCLATNMISVGVDIPRLGLMTVIGQPKTTSEYIQATSRVGRSKKGPGVVFTIYNCSKPRDRSHFEHFQEYHSKIYSKVEPTSVTPFSAPARERALHAILIGLIRYYSTDQSSTSPRPFPNKELVDRVTQIIYDRVNLIDEEEYDKTYELIEEKLEYWKNELPLIYGSFGQMINIPLMYPAGTNPSEDIKERAWSTPTSMRNVDSTCEAYVIPAEYINIDD